MTLLADVLNLKSTISIFVHGFCTLRSYSHQNRVEALKKLPMFTQLRIKVNEGYPISVLTIWLYTNELSIKKSKLGRTVKHKSVCLYLL